MNSDNASYFAIDKLTQDLLIGIGGASGLRPSHTTVRTGPYTAVREVELTRFEQGWERLAHGFGIVGNHGEIGAG